ncbi:hypothetical protein TWF481_001729 [Arthrobotrys musiformis]|uniref:Uncharacterized protein n=1 Tax=Arthrobotrys musiformis TaxID=47236 RepID=A0AAV9VU44_9PEZI
MISSNIKLQTILAVLTTSASGLIIDVVQSVPGKTNLPTLRLCRPLTSQPPTTVNPLKASCPDSGSAFWLWNYNAQPSEQSQSLINLLGVTSNSRETPYLLSQATENTLFEYGFTNAGLRYQPSVFKVKRNGAYQGIDSNNQLQVGDELEYFGPTINNGDKTLRIQSQSKSAPVLTRQLTDSSGKALQSSTTYPTVTLRINSLGNTELVLPTGNWLQRGAQGLTNIANTIKSGVNTYIANPLANTATYIQNNVPQWQGLLTKAGNVVYDKTGAAINNGINYISQPLSNAGNWVGTKLVNGVDYANNALDKAGNWVGTKLVNGIDYANNALDNAVRYATTPFETGGQWIEKVANNYIAQPIAQTGQWIANTAGNAYNTAIQDLNGVGSALGQGWQAAKDVTNLGVANAGGWVRGQVNTALKGVDGWVNGGVPLLRTVGGQYVQAAPSLIQVAAYPVQSGSPSDANANALPVVAPQGLGGSAIGGTLRTGGEYVDDDFPYDMSASQFFVPGQA